MKTFANCVNSKADVWVIKRFGKPIVFETSRDKKNWKCTSC